ncbi:RhoGEF domain-containing protein [Purpureocillium lavendulum]|uniref:RhoGEF domain-containing protein n=1 Tax=Purpureocillium lavendulum TaxID=1247861 RepID=A0AB34FD90_9HYPO|nr:RhoGEF domain-containing protein [Purpureocillium lavendulum]
MKAPAAAAAVNINSSSNSNSNSNTDHGPGPSPRRIHPNITAASTTTTTTTTSPTTVTSESASTTGHPRGVGAATTRTTSPRGTADAAAAANTTSPISRASRESRASRGSRASKESRHRSSKESRGSRAGSRGSRAGSRGSKASSKGSSNGKGHGRSSTTTASASTPRVILGRGALARLPAELARLGVCAPLIVSSPSRVALARRIQTTLLPALDSRILDSAVVSVPARVVDRALDRGGHGRDAVVSVGGASAVGLAAAIALRRGLPHVCVPTTYSGSEMMPLLCDASPARHNTLDTYPYASAAAAAMALAAAEAGPDDDDHDDHRHQEQHRNWPMHLQQPQQQQHQQSAGKSKNKNRRSSGGGGGGSTTSVRDPRVVPTLVIYDEDLTGSGAPERFSAPTGIAARARVDDFADGLKDDEYETAAWSYLHLPGV